jgi:hypothetical protein
MKNWKVHFVSFYFFWQFTLTVFYRHTHTYTKFMTNQREGGRRTWWYLIRNTMRRSGQTFFIQGQTVNILGSVNHIMVCVAISQLCYDGIKVATDEM